MGFNRALCFSEEQQHCGPYKRAGAGDTAHGLKPEPLGRATKWRGAPSK
jgi:hypothetical protein